MSRPVVWILVHRLDGGGAPAVLVRYLRWLRSPGGSALDALPQVHVIAAGGGRWVPEVASLADSCTVLGPAEGRSAATTVAVASAQLGHPAAGAALQGRWSRHRVRTLPAPDTVLVHGAGAWPLWRSLAPAAGRARLVLHLHELQVAIGRSVAPDELPALAAEPDLIASVCRPDAGLGELLGDRADEVAVVPGCTDGDVAPGLPPAGRPAAREVVVVGEAGWRKGADRFEALAHELARDTDLVFRWIGDPPPPPWQLAVGVPSPVRWDGPSSDPWTSVARGSIVVVPSREDPLPLAALEAGGRGLPVVASGAGGLGDLLDDGCGWFVATADLSSLVAAVRAAADDPAAAAQRGAALQARVAAGYTPEAVGPRWATLLTGG